MLEFFIILVIFFGLIIVKAKKCNQNSNKWLIISLICFVGVFYLSFTILPVVLPLDNNNHILKMFAEAYVANKKELINLSKIFGLISILIILIFFIKPQKKYEVKS